MPSLIFLFSVLPVQVCTHWLKGNCAYGDKCRYDHARPEWAPRQDQSVPGYVPPPVLKPSSDTLETVPPISHLRLGGALAPLSEHDFSSGHSHDASLPAEEVEAKEEESLVAAVNLPADPFGSGAGISEGLGALSLGDTLPDDLGLGSVSKPDDVEEEGCLPSILSTYDPQHVVGDQEGRHYDHQNAFFDQMNGIAQQWHDLGGQYDGGTTAESAGVYVNGTAEDHHEEGFEEGFEQYSDRFSQEYGSEDAAALPNAVNATNGYYGEYGSGAEGELDYTSLPGGRSSIGYGSYGGHSSGGEYGFGEFPTSAGTSPPLPAWHVPGGGGSDGGWGSGSRADLTSKFYTSPALASLCWDFYSSGMCPQNKTCPLAHGDWCNTCCRYALHPTDEEARKSHEIECSARHSRLEGLRRSAHVECNICLEKVSEKLNPGERRFGLLQNCEHAFCLSCIRNWRQQYSGGADVDGALRTCPICRTSTHFVTPSTVWPASQEEKEAIIEGYKSKLREIDCKYFSFGEGTCPFGTSCLYRHAYPDGRLEEAAPRRVAADEGEIHVVQPVRLSDFIVVQRGRVRGHRRR